MRRRTTEVLKGPQSRWMDMLKVVKVVVSVVKVAIMVVGEPMDVVDVTVNQISALLDVKYIFVTRLILNLLYRVTQKKVHILKANKTKSITERGMFVQKYKMVFKTIKYRFQQDGATESTPLGYQ